MGLRTTSARRPLAAACAAMVPALTETSQPHTFEQLVNAKPALDKLDNTTQAAEMNKVDVADQNAPDPAEFFTEDIMQVIKSMESSAGGELLFNDVDMEEPADVKDEIRTKDMLEVVSMTQQRLEKRLAFLLRRTRRFQAKGLALHFSQEIAGIFEMGHRAMRKKKIESGRVIYKKIEDRPYTPPSIRDNGYGKLNEFVPNPAALRKFPTGNSHYMDQPKPHISRDPFRLCENDDRLYPKHEPSMNNSLLNRRADINTRRFHPPMRRNGPGIMTNRPNSDIYFNLGIPRYSNTKFTGVDLPNTVLDLRKGVKVTEGDVLRNIENSGKINSIDSDESKIARRQKESPHLNLIEAESPRYKTGESLNLSLKLENKNITEHDNLDNNSLNKHLKEKSNEVENLLTDRWLNSNVIKEEEDFENKDKDKKCNIKLLQDIVINSSHTVDQESQTKESPSYSKPAMNVLQDRPLPISDDNCIKKPILASSVKNLCKKFGIATAMQGNNVFRHRHTTPGRYFGSGSVVVGTQPRGSSAVTLGHFPLESKREMQRFTGHLMSEVKMVQDGLDSEATASSSGGESCDEMQPYTNPHQQYLPIYKRAAWKYATDRAAIVARWTWLQAQISNLKYKIKHFTEVHRRIRASKDVIRMGGTSPSLNTCSASSVNGFRGQTPGAGEDKSCDTAADIQCSRTRPLIHFRKRKLLSLNGLHLVSKKASRPASIRCSCSTPKEECALCTGRLDPLNPRDVTEYLSTHEMLGLLDSCYHPIISMEEDASSSLHMESVMRTEDWQTRSTSRTHQKAIRFPKMNRTEKVSSGEHRPSRKSEYRKKSNRLRQSAALSAKIKSRYRGKKHARTRSLDGADDEVESGIGGTNMGFTKRSRVDSYDIDNIIIPYSVAASTRVEKLQYKEILTPKWRIADHEFSAKYDLKNNGSVKASQEISTNEEDISEDVVMRRHEKCEQEEKKKFLSYLKLPIGYGRTRTNRRVDSRAESSGANSPEPMSPTHTSQNTSENPSDSPMTTPPATPAPALHRRTSMHSKHSSSTAATSTSTSPTDQRQRSSSPQDLPEVLPYEKRTFPITQETYDRMLKSIPEHHKVTTNVRSQDSYNLIASPPTTSEPEHDSESTESAFGDEDPNDPEWDLERVKDKYRR